MDLVIGVFDGVFEEFLVFAFAKTGCDGTFLLLEFGSFFEIGGGIDLDLQITHLLVALLFIFLDFGKIAASILLILGFQFALLI